MKICHLTLNPIDLERRTFNQAEPTYLNNWQVVIVADGQHTEPKRQQPTFGTLQRINTEWFKGGPLKFILFNIKLLGVLLVNRYSIVHSNNLWTLSAAMMSLVSRFIMIYNAYEYDAGLEIFTRRKVREAIWDIVLNDLNTMFLKTR
jgi:hypothetical protein